jgi:hypothetical protein
LPWRIWLGLLAAIAISTFVCFGAAESTKTSDPGTWYVAGFAAAAALTLVGAVVTLSNRPWREVAIFGGLVATVVAVAIFSVTSPSTSRSCNNDGQPRSAGTYDCDTSDSVGGPIVLVAFFIPAFAISSLGKVGRMLRR